MLSAPHAPARVITAFLTLALWGVPVLAGRNDGASILLHVNESYTYSAGSACSPGSGVLPLSCDGVDARADGGAAVLWLIAAFDPGASPEVASIRFGIDYSVDSLSVERFTLCGPDPLHSADDPWPYVPGRCEVFFRPSVVETIFPFLAFDVRGETPGAWFSVTADPSLDLATMTDGGDPPVTDSITRLGAVRWGAGGTAPCPAPPRPGACCLAWPGDCVELVSEAECRDLFGRWGGIGTTCAQDGCGACCYWRDEGGGAYTRACVFTTRQECDDPLDEVEIRGVGSEWHGVGVLCAVDPYQEDSLRVWCEVDMPDEVSVCCLEEGCSHLTARDCRAIGGEWHPDSDCAWSGMCSKHPCCLADGSCVLVTTRGCSLLGGDTQPGVECTGSTCVPEAPLRTSWGSIRSLYR
jgi:hypothetical protein